MGAGLYRQRPTENELAAVGLTWADVADQFEVEVWPDNWPAAVVFSSLQTQWRVGPGGPYGLDYSAIPDVLRMSSVPRSQWPEVFEAVQVMEAAALGAMHKK
ncbi:DUF1799 domain-containing protein [Caldimonas brevitalea]|uniref:DUF1799 domain-containing protein n=1 Tax=Caldimonas brevitalea TaxID=413882 RepID=A0A0G3BLI7_9BURK|nr:DUF1799 domain-containing protein [Caldimonas brevitalea]AKJ28843.1 hypothetical protein AAW51_2152 [Caldimonas brevitalea]